MEEVRKRVVEVYGGLPWRKNLHGSMGLSTYWVKKVEKMKKMEENGVGRERGEEREMECGMLGILI